MKHLLAAFFRALAAIVILSLGVYGANPIQLENAKPGVTDWPLTNPATLREIEGYASLTSVNRGGQIKFFVNTADPTFTLDIYRMGWYGGAGARRMMNTVSLPGTVQTIPAPDSITGLVECAWLNPYTLNVPYDANDPTVWASGFYLAKLTGSVSQKQSYIIFVVRDDARSSALVFQSSVLTWEAYNGWGGKSLYPFNSNGPQAVKVSLNRPYGLGQNSTSASGLGAGDFFTTNAPSYETYSAGWEYNMVRFLEREGYDVTYITDVDTHENGNLLLNHKAFLSVGHNEYWTWQMRNSVEGARDRGINLAFFSSNDSYWQVRLEPSVSSGQFDRTVVGYKETALTQDPYASSPTQSYLTTGYWRNAPVNRPEDAMIGVMYVANPVNGDIIVADASSWIYTYTGLVNGVALHGLLGYEVDAVGPETPANADVVAHSPWDVGAYSDMTVYQAPSGAMVFATGSMQWNWALDDYNVPGARPSVLNYAAQQITRNILARFTGSSLSPSFSIGSTPSSVTFLPGNPANVTVTTASFGYSPTLALSVSGLPSGITATLSPSNISGSGSALLTLSSSASVAVGSYVATIVASDGVRQETTSVAVNITNAIPQAAWLLVYADSQETTCDNGKATNAFDGSSTTLWITQYCGGTATYPHEIRINLGKTYSLAGFTYLPRQDGGVNGRIAQYEFYVSPDGSLWGPPVATGTFANDATKKQISFPSTLGQFIKLRALSEVNGGPWTTVAELGALIGPTPTQPRGFITSPATNPAKVATATALQFTAQGLDPNNLPLTYHWNFGAGSGVPDSTAQNPSVIFSAPGTYTVTLTVTNSNGISDPRPPTIVIKVGPIPHTNWVLKYVDSQETVCENGAAKNAFDDNNATNWITQYCSSTALLPHEIQFDLGAIYNVGGFTYLPRQDGGINGTIAKYEFYVSSDGTNWGAPIASGTFTADTSEKDVTFPARSARYVRFRAISEINGGPWTSLAEFNVLSAAPSTAPVGQITAPTSDVTIPMGSLVTFTGSGTDPNNLPLTYYWDFGAGSGILPANVQNPGPVLFSNPGTFTVTLTVTNSKGTSDPWPPHRTVTVGPIPQTNWTLKYVDSQETACENGSATNAFDGNPATNWITQYCSGSPPPPHEIQINLGRSYTINGFRYLPRQDGLNGRIGQYEFYVSTDGVNWGTPVATGTFASDASEKQILFPATLGQFVRLRALTEINGNPWSSAAEINVLGH